MAAAGIKNQMASRMMTSMLNMRNSVFMLAMVLMSITNTVAQTHTHHHHHSDHAMSLDVDGMTMNSNGDVLPRDCDKVTAEIEVEVRVGRQYAMRGFTFGFNNHEWRVPPCSRITVTLINEDEIRHQWMVHGLPRYIYSQGMFHLETSGGKRRTGTFIVPSDNVTYLVHCDISHHMEQGLKGQIRVGTSQGSLPSIPGISGALYPDKY
jgi:hypothetical protein